jgi:hypothetical protein
LILEQHQQFIDPILYLYQLNVIDHGIRHGHVLLIYNSFWNKFNPENQSTSSNQSYHIVHHSQQHNSTTAEPTIIPSIIPSIFTFAQMPL